jgi:hypothetical protein
VWGSLTPFYDGQTILTDHRSMTAAVIRFALIDSRYTHAWGLHTGDSPYNLAILIGARVNRAAPSSRRTAPSSSDQPVHTHYGGRSETVRT